MGWNYSITQVIQYNIALQFHIVFTNNFEFLIFNSLFFVSASEKKKKKERTVDALALGGDEGRGKLR